MAIEPISAIKTILEKVSYNKFEIIPIEESSERIIAEDIFARYFLPKFDNSAMDGYAVKINNNTQKIDVVGKIFAGDIVNFELEDNQTYKIMTGAIIPKGTEAIVPQEEVTIVNENQIILPANIKKSQHIRYIGEDIKIGEQLIQKGETINFAKVTLLASQGISHIKVYQKPKAAVFASGEELKLHYEKIDEHQIYNSNTPTLIARAKELGCKTKFVGCAKDNINSLKELITNSLDSDLIVTSGGVSVGEADFTQDAFNEFDFEIYINGIYIKPGKPTLFGKINNSYILNLPGNPLASALIFEVFGKQIIQKLIGSKDIYFSYIQAKISEDIKTKGRTTIMPGFFDGITFTPNSKSSPGMVNVLANCNSLIIIDKDSKNITKDSSVKVLPINWKFFSEIEKDFITK